MKTIAFVIAIAWAISLDELRIVKVRDWNLRMKAGTTEWEWDNPMGFHYQLIRPLEKQKVKP